MFIIYEVNINLEKSWQPFEFCPQATGETNYVTKVVHLQLNPKGSKLGSIIRSHKINPVVD